MNWLKITLLTGAALASMYGYSQDTKKILKGDTGVNTIKVDTTLVKKIQELTDSDYVIPTKYFAQVRAKADETDYSVANRINLLNKSTEQDILPLLERFESDPSFDEGYKNIKFVTFNPDTKRYTAYGDYFMSFVASEKDLQDKDAAFPWLAIANNYQDYALQEVNENSSLNEKVQDSISKNKKIGFGLGAGVFYPFDSKENGYSQGQYFSTLFDLGKINVDFMYVNGVNQESEEQERTILESESGNSGLRRELAQYTDRFQSSAINAGLGLGYDIDLPNGSRFTPRVLVFGGSSTLNKSQYKQDEFFDQNGNFVGLGTDGSTSRIVSYDPPAFGVKAYGAGLGFTLPSGFGVDANVVRTTNDDTALNAGIHYKF